MFGLGVLGLIVAVNRIGVGKASGLQIGIVFFFLASLGVLVMAGSTSVTHEHLQPAFPQGASGVLIAVLMVLLPVDKLANLSSGYQIFIFMVVNLSVIVLPVANARFCCDPKAGDSRATRTHIQHVYRLIGEFQTTRRAGFHTR
jgi:uncharacterized membrane protein YkvI